VPEGLGWRRGLAEFMGDNDTSAFYAAVEAAIVKDGVVSTKAELLAAISGTFTDEAVAAQALVAANTSTCEFSTGARTACNEGEGCGQGVANVTAAEGAGDISAAAGRRPRAVAALLLAAALARYV